MAELGLPVMDINVSESPAIGEKFSRLRDELWWRVACPHPMWLMRLC